MGKYYTGSAFEPNLRSISATCQLAHGNIGRWEKHYEWWLRQKDDNDIMMPWQRNADDGVNLMAEPIYSDTNILSHTIYKSKLSKVGVYFMGPTASTVDYLGNSILASYETKQTCWVRKPYIWQWYG